MPYYNGTWLSDEEYEAVTQAVTGTGEDDLNGRMGGYDPAGNWNVGAIPAGGDARDRGGASPRSGAFAGIDSDMGGNGLTPRVQPSNNRMDPRWGQPNSGQEAMDHYGGGADRGAVQPYRPTTPQPVARPAATGGTVARPTAAAAGQPARPDNQRPGESYQQYLTRFYGAYGQQPPQAAGAAQPAARPTTGASAGPAARPTMQNYGGDAAREPAVPPRGWDEAAYLRANPDVAAALRRGGAGVVSGYDHYINHGIGERRQTAPNLGGMNEQEYLARNPDVAAAIGRGQFASAWDHWNSYGKNEVRAGGRGLNAFEQANPWAIGMTAGAVQAAQQRPATPTGPSAEQQRAAQVAGIRPKIVGVDRWGAQLVGFDNVPAGVTLSNDELGRMAQNAGYGAAAVQQGWRDRGGGRAEAGPRAMPEPQPAAAPTAATAPRASVWDAPVTQPRSDVPVTTDNYEKWEGNRNPEIWGINLPDQRGMQEERPPRGAAGGYSEGVSKAPQATGEMGPSQTIGGYDWGNPVPSPADKVLFGDGGLPPEDDEDDEEKIKK